MRWSKPSITTLALLGAVLVPAALPAQGVTARVLNNNSNSAWTLTLTGTPTGSLYIEKASGKVVGTLSKAGDSVTLVKKEDFALRFTSAGGSLGMAFQIADKNKAFAKFVATVSNRNLDLSYAPNDMVNPQGKVAIRLDGSKGIVIDLDTLK